MTEMFKTAFHDLVRHTFHGSPLPPFNAEERAEAGIPPDFSRPLADRAAEPADDFGGNPPCAPEGRITQGFKIVAAA